MVRKLIISLATPHEGLHAYRELSTQCAGRPTGDSFLSQQLFAAHKIPHKFLNFLSLVQIFSPFQKRLFQLEETAKQQLMAPVLLRNSLRQVKSCYTLIRKSWSEIPVQVYAFIKTGLLLYPCHHLTWQRRRGLISIWSLLTNNRKGYRFDVINRVKGKHVQM